MPSIPGFILALLPIIINPSLCHPLNSTLQLKSASLSDPLANLVADPSGLLTLHLDNNVLRSIAADMSTVIDRRYLNPRQLHALESPSSNGHKTKLMDTSVGIQLAPDTENDGSFAPGNDTTDTDTTPIPSHLLLQSGDPHCWRFKICTNSSECRPYCMFCVARIIDDAVISRRCMRGS